MKLLLLFVIVLWGSRPTALWSAPNPAPETPGQNYTLPTMPAGDGAPVVYAFSRDAAPDESFFIVGERLGSLVHIWGRTDSGRIGGLYEAETKFCDGNYLIATIPEKCYDGPFAVWISNEKGRSEPFILNQPEPWWCVPNVAHAGETVRIFGRNLARRPDSRAAFVYLCKRGRKGVWLDVKQRGKYHLAVSLPKKLDEGWYELWVHAGAGGEYGWGKPLRLRIIRPVHRWTLPVSISGDGDVQQAVNRAAKNGATVKLPEGTFLLSSTLEIPAGVKVQGAGRDKTFLQIAPNVAAFPRLMFSRWNSGVGSIHNIGDSLEYAIRVPTAGKWHVWLRYATEMSKWGMDGMDNRTALIVDDGEPVFLANLPNTGSFGTFKWSRTATLQLDEGEHRLVWRNLKGGGLNLDALVLTTNDDFVPSDEPFPSGGRDVIVIQAEDVKRMMTKEGKLPGDDRAVVWLKGDGASISDLTILGSAQVNIGVLVASPPNRTENARKWIKNCRIERVRIADIERKRGEICGVRLENSAYAVVRDSELYARAPIYFTGIYQCQFIGNRLVPTTRYGPNANAAILGHTGRMEECVVENNIVACPESAEAGGATVRRLIWISTGKGSVTHNYIAGNRGERARYGGVAGTEQNVGEIILFEANQRVAFYGAIEGADADTITLPESVPPTPDELLGNVTRRQLVVTADGREAPFFPPDRDDGSREPPITEYYVTVLKGKGRGQTRRVVGRVGNTLRLSAPWRVKPEKGAVVVVSTLYYQNIILNNETLDGMSGVQLWIGRVENIVSGNVAKRLRKPGLYMFGTCTTLASSMPRTWNRGIGPFNWNTCEGNYTEVCSTGMVLVATDRMPIEWARALGNVVRHNSFVSSRFDGLYISSRNTKGQKGESIVGTIVEFNLVRDARRAFRTGMNVGVTLFRRNHVYFWTPVAPEEEPIAFHITNPDTPALIEDNNVIEGPHGTGAGRFIKIQRGEEEK